MLDFAKIEEKIGYTFQDKALLKTAFTHSSFVNLHGGESNERMEYLGDAVLQLLVSEKQFGEAEKQSEGVMTKRRQELVCESSLLEAVEKMGVAEYLLVEGGAANIGKKTVSSLYECLLAAVYLDGGYEAAKGFFTRNGLRGRIENYKSALQEYLQKNRQALPVYSLLKKEGTDDKPVFYCQVSAWGVTAEGAGESKAAAERLAAKALLEKLKKEEKKV